MKKFFLFFATALFCANVSADQAVTVNLNATATQGHFPVYGVNADTETDPARTKGLQAIYLADQLKDIAVGSEIKALTFYSANPNQSWGKAEFKVSLAKTDNSSFKKVSGSYAEWAVISEGSTLTEVYDGPLSVVDGELTINFTTPYAYEGGNLLIQVEVSRKGNSSASSFYSAATTDYLIKYAYSGSSCDAMQPKLTLVIAGGGDDPVSQNCKAPTAVTVGSVKDETATVSWEGEASQYQYCVEYAGSQPDWTKATLTNQKSVSLSGLWPEEKYYFYVRSYCSETEVSEAVKATFTTVCARQNVPWVETFTRDEASYEYTTVAPECWTISSVNPTVVVVADKNSADEAVLNQGHLYGLGGSASNVQVFALPAFDADLDTLEVAFDYKTSLVGNQYASLEVGYMTIPSNASSFVSLQVLPQTLDEYKHAIVTLERVPKNANFIAFRFAGATNSDYGNFCMDDFVVAKIGTSGDVDKEAVEDLPKDDNLYSQTYCDAGYTFYYKGDEQYFGMVIYSDDLNDAVAGVWASTGDCTQFADADGVEFSTSDPDAEYRYYFNTRYILNVDEVGLMKFGAFDACTVNIGGTGANAQLGLKSGNYHVVVREAYVTYDEEGYATGVTGVGDTIAIIHFTLTGKVVSNLQAVVAEDHQTATLTWDAPELAPGERLYVRVWSGETVAYDNFETKERPESPMSVNVVEGKSYTAIVQVIDRKQNPQGPEVQTTFTVGVNQYEPQNPTAVVTGGDNVTFSWNATTQADAYVITLYLDGKFYTTLNVHSTTKTTTTPADGTWSWTVQAFNQGSNGNYFEASAAVAGNDFVSKAADVPDDAVVLEIADFNAFIIDQNSKYAAELPEGKTGWVLIFRSNDGGYAGYPIAWFLVYTDKERAISGVYNTTRGNIDLASCMLIPDVDASPSDYIFAEDAEVRLQFDGYDDEKYEEGYILAYYTGSFRLVDKNGKTYVAKFMEQFCYSGNYDMYESGNASYEGMYEEDPDYYQGIEEIVAATPDSKKVLYNGQILIIRDGKAYNMLGTLVK